MPKENRCQERIDARREWMPSEFSWQAQYYLVKLESLFVAGAAFREILEDSRSAKCCIFHTKCISKMGRVRSPKRRVRDDNFMLG